MASATKGISRKMIIICDGEDTKHYNVGRFTRYDQEAMAYFSRDLVKEFLETRRKFVEASGKKFDPSIYSDTITKLGEKQREMAKRAEQYFMLASASMNCNQELDRAYHCGDSEVMTAKSNELRELNTQKEKLLYPGLRS